MNKEEFLKTLRKKLSILEESEIDDIINEYEGYIEEKIAKGSTEEEAVSSMGDVSELARDLLSAYKIREPEEKSKDAFNHFADNCIHVFERIIDMFSHKSLNEILRFVIEILVIFLIIAICKIPFEIIESFGRNALYSIGGGFFKVLANVWSCILEFVYLIFAILLFVKIFQSRYLDNAENTRSFSFRETKREDVFEEKKEKKAKEVKDSYAQEDKKENKRREREHERLGIIDTFVDLCMLFIKMIAFFILIGVIFYIVGMSITVGFSIYLLFKGVFYFGIYLILLSLAILGIVAFIYLYNFIFNHKNRIGVLLIISLVSFVVLGLGVGVCAIEFASTTIVYNEKSDKNAVVDYTYEMEDNLVLARALEGENINIDDALGEKIKLEYKYNDSYYQIKAEPYTSKIYGYKIMHYGYHIREFTYSKKIFDSFLQDLKNKTIYIFDDNVEVTLTMSQKTYNKLMENEKNYNKIVYHEEDLEDICEDYYDRGIAIPEYCQPFHFNHM